LGEISTIDYVPLGKHIIEAKNTPYFPIRKEVYVNYSGQVLSVVIDGDEHDLYEYDYEKDGQLVVSDNWLKGRRHNGEFSDSGEYLSLKKDGSTIKLRWKLYVRRKDGFKIGKGDYTKEFYTSLNLQIGKDSTELSISGKDVFSVETKELVWNNHSINLGFYGFRIQQIGPVGDQQ